MNNKKTDSLDTDINPGDFPFPLAHGTREPRHLTWLRHNSNYLATRGLHDYLRTIGVLVRGILLNLLVILPYLFSVALVLGLMYQPMRENPYIVSYWIGISVFIYIGFYPLVTSMFNILRHKRTLAHGSNSSVKSRDFFERSFGYALFILATILLVETFPFILDAFHNLKKSGDFFKNGNLSLIGVLTLATIADRLLSSLSGLKRTLVMVLFALLGLLIPLLIVLFVVDYLVYGTSPNIRTLMVLTTVPVIAIIAIILALVVGMINRVFSWKEIRGGMITLICAIGLLGGGLYVLANTPVDKNWPPDTKVDIVKDEAFYLQAGLIRLWDKPQYRTLLEPLDNILNMDVKHVTELHSLQKEHKELGRDLKELTEKRATLAAIDNPGSSAWGKLFDEITEQEAQLEERQLKNNLGIEKYYYRFKVAEDAFFNELIALQREESLSAKLVDLRRELKKQVKAGTIEKYYYKLSRLLLQGNIIDFTHFVTINDIEKEFGIFASLDAERISRKLDTVHRWNKFALIALSIFVLSAFCWIVVDVNLTSIHSFYRDRLASTFLMGSNTKGDVVIEEDIDLEDICCYQAGSTAPYHLINVALNLQGSNDTDVRDRKCSFFIFSKRFIGGNRTGYCRSELMEQVFPQVDLATAMAISAAAASPNMGRSTHPALVALMTILNIRLGVWVPNPGILEQRKNRSRWRRRKDHGTSDDSNRGYRFDEVFRAELDEIKMRWQQTYTSPDGRSPDPESSRPSVTHGLVGLALSGGGIRSATINLGIVQVLHKLGVFPHIDYMSTVSGGGYLGSSISTLMRSKTRVTSEAKGVVKIDSDESLSNRNEQVIEIETDQDSNPHVYSFTDAAEINVKEGERIEAGTRLIKRISAATLSDIDGQIEIKILADGEQIVTVKNSDQEDDCVYQFSRLEELNVTHGDIINRGEPLTQAYNSYANRFRWRTRPILFLRELFSRLDAAHRWVNLSDGGHIENLGAFELLRRRCKYIIVGDGEADEKLQFGGLATLIRTARIDLGIHIDINLDKLALNEDGYSEEHCAIGKIHYPGENVPALLLYFKSSMTGDEDTSIKEYRFNNPSFPHQSTADQFFQEGQFEAYRALGQHIGESVFSAHNQPTNFNVNNHPKEKTKTISYADFEHWIGELVAKA